MSARLIDGKAISASVREGIRKEVAALKAAGERVPGLGVILVGVLGLALNRLPLANALKSAIAAVTASITVVVFGIFGDVHWGVVAVAAPASLLGGFLGARIATRIPATALRVLIVVFGVAVSVYLFARA